MTAQFTTFLKRHAIALIGIAVMFGGTIWYVAYTDTNVVTRDQWGFLSMIDHYEKSALTFNDFWEGHSVHRLPAYRALFLLDAVWFHLNLVLESYVGVICLAISAFYLYLRYDESLGRSQGRAGVQLSFLVLCSVLFSFNQWALYIYSLSTLDSFLGNLCFVAAWFYLDRGLDSPTTSLRFEIGLSLFLMLFLLCFGEGRSPAIIAATLAVVAFKNLSKDERAPRQSWRLFVILCCACVVAEVVYFGLGASVPSSTSYLEAMLKDPVGDARYVLIAMEISVVSTITNANFHDYVNYVIGSLVFAGYVGAFWLYWKERMVHKTRMPMFLMLYSLLYLGLIMIGRFRGGASGPVDPYPRYVTDLDLGIIGIAWVFYLWISTTAGSALFVRVGPRLTVTAITACLVVAQLYGARDAINGSRYQRAAIQRFQKFLLSDSSDKYQLNPPPIFYCPAVSQCIDGEKILRENHLAPFDHEIQR